MIIQTEGSTEAQASDAEKVMHILTTCYPGHPWAVRVHEGIIFIRHLHFGTNWGMNIRTKEVDHDAAVMKRVIVRLAGEWLERAGLARGRFDADAPVTAVEGVPKPKESDANIEISDSKENLRDAPRPQVLKALRGTP